VASLGFLHNQIGVENNIHGTDDKAQLHVQRIKSLEISIEENAENKGTYQEPN
jgi:hypothetical protein